MNRLSIRLVPHAAAVLGLTLVAWIVAVERMRGMDVGAGADLGAFPWFLGLWLTMMAAMMLSAAAPMVLTFAAVARARARRGGAHVPAWIFVCGYLAVWGAFGVLAYGVATVIRALDPPFLAWDEQGPLVVGGAIAAAGIYELTLLNVCASRTAAGRCTSCSVAGGTATRAPCGWGPSTVSTASAAAGA